MPRQARRKVDRVLRRLPPPRKARHDRELQRLIKEAQDQYPSRHILPAQPPEDIEVFRPWACQLHLSPIVALLTFSMLICVGSGQVIEADFGEREGEERRIGAPDFDVVGAASSGIAVAEIFGKADSSAVPLYNEQFTGIAEDCMPEKSLEELFVSGCREQLRVRLETEEPSSADFVNFFHFVYAGKVELVDHLLNFPPYFEFLFKGSARRRVRDVSSIISPLRESSLYSYVAWALNGKKYSPVFLLMCIDTNNITMAKLFFRYAISDDAIKRIVTEEWKDSSLNQKGKLIVPKISDEMFEVFTDSFFVSSLNNPDYLNHLLKARRFNVVRKILAKSSWKHHLASRLESSVRAQDFEVVEFLVKLPVYQKAILSGDLDLASMLLGMATYTNADLIRDFLEVLQRNLPTSYKVTIWNSSIYSKLSDISNEMFKVLLDSSLVPPLNDRRIIEHLIERRSLKVVRKIFSNEDLDIDFRYFLRYLVQKEDIEVLDLVMGSPAGQKFLSSERLEIGSLISKKVKANKTSLVERTLNILRKHLRSTHSVGIYFHHLTVDQISDEMIVLLATLEPPFIFGQLDLESELIRAKRYWALEAVLQHSKRHDSHRIRIFQETMELGDYKALEIFLNINFYQRAIIAGGWMTSHAIQERVISETPGSKGYKEAVVFLRSSPYKKLLKERPDLARDFWDSCVLHNNRRIAKLFFEMGVVLSAKELGESLKYSLRMKHYPIAKIILIEGYSKNNISLSESEAFDMVEKLWLNLEMRYDGTEAKPGPWLKSFHGPLIRITGEAKEVTKVIPALAFLGLVFLIYLCINRKKGARERFWLGFLKRLGIEGHITKKLNTYLEKAQESGVDLAEASLLDPLTHGLMFPGAVILSDGYTKLYDPKFFSKAAAGEFALGVLEAESYRDLRPNWNYIFAVQWLIKRRIENDVDLDDEEREQLLVDLEKVLTGPTVEKIRQIVEPEGRDDSSFPPAIFNPRTKEKMTTPCIASNGISYQVDCSAHRGKASFKTGIEGLGEVIVWRNYELGSLIRRLARAKKEFALMEPREPVVGAAAQAAAAGPV